MIRVKATVERSFMEAVEEMRIISMRLRNAVKFVQTLGTCRMMPLILQLVQRRVSGAEIWSG